MRNRSAVFQIAVLLALLGIAAPLRAQSLELDRDRAFGMLDEVSRDVEKNFYDPNLKGLDWKGLIEQTKQRIQAAKVPGQMFTAIFSLLEKLDDSHTVFLPPSRVGRVRFGFDAKAYGEEVRIHDLDAKGAAARAGLQKGDRIHSINNIPVDRWSWDKVMMYLRVLRPVMEMEIVYSRGNEAPRSVRFEGDYQAGRMEVDLSYAGTDVYDLIREAQTNKKPFRRGMQGEGVGWIEMPYFTGDKGWLQDLVNKVDQSRALIFDLRGNRGGSVEGLAYLVGMLEPEETVIANMAGRKKTEPVKAKPGRPNLNVPLFILVDSECSSACEVFARYFQRRGRGVVIGDQTSGFVSVARIFDKQIGQNTLVFYAAEVTIARLIFPDGEELEKRGVTPDRACVPTGADLREGRDPCRALALQLAREKLGVAAKAPGDAPKQD
jgi:carboxyl-terminal processing protease